MVDKVTFVEGIIALLLMMLTLINIVALVAKQYLESSSHKMITVAQWTAGVILVVWLLKLIFPLQWSL